MVDVVEEFRQVEIHCDAVTGLDVGLDLLECAMGSAFWSEAVTRFGEFRIEDRRHDLGDGLLDHPIYYGRDTQRAFSSIRFRNTDPTYRLRLITAISQGLADRRPVCAGVRREVFDAQTVYARCASVGLHAAPCLLQVGWREYCLHQVFVQGWLGGATPITGSPDRVQCRVRVGHGSSLSVYVRPFVAPGGRDYYGLC